MNSHKRNKTMSCKRWRKTWQLLKDGLTVAVEEDAAAAADEPTDELTEEKRTGKKIMNLQYW